MKYKRGYAMLLNLVYTIKSFKYNPTNHFIYLETLIEKYGSE